MAKITIQSLYFAIVKGIKWISLLICCMYTHIHAQQFRFVNVSNELKIPSPVCYNVVRDHQGYIWICTEAGLCRYDGTSTKIFDAKNGLPEASIYDISEDPSHNVWFATSTNRLLTYVNDSLVELPISKKYTRFVNDEFSTPFKITFISNTEMYVNSRTGAYKIDLGANTVASLDVEDPVPFKFIETGEKMLLLKSRNNSVRWKGISFDINFENGEKISVSLPPYKQYSPHWRMEMIRINDCYFLGIDNYVLKIDNNHSVTIIPFKTRILSLYNDQNNGLWIGTFKSGLYYYSDIYNLKKPVHTLPELSISGVTSDYEGAIWCSSLEKGIYYCANKNIIDYTNISGLDRFIDLLKYENGKIYVSSGNGTLFEIGSEIKNYSIRSIINNSLHDILKIKDGWYISTTPKLTKFNNTFTAYTIPIGTNGVNISAYQFAVDKNNKIYAAGYGIITEIRRGKSVIHILPFNIPTKRILAQNNGHLYVGTDKGLYDLNPEDFSFKKIWGNRQITQLAKSSGGIWFSTKGGGLYRIIDNSIQPVSRQLGIPTEFFYDVIEDKYHTIWAASNIGLIKIYQSEGKYLYDVYDILDGLPSSLVYKVTVNDEHVFLATIEGVSSFPLQTSLKNYTEPNIYLKQIFINDQPIQKPKHKELVLPYNKNSLRFVFDVTSYRNFNHKKLLYTLEGTETKSQEVIGNELVFDNMQPDHYTLQVYAVNDDNVYSKRPITFSIIITKPFWQTPWFIALAVVVFGLALYYSVKNIIDRVKSREEAKTQINKMMAEYQLTALQAQMNPHFIFNAINSIQGYILQKDENQAYNYLAKFSKLIRMVLNNSEQKILSLQQELETLELYIQLEQLRFENKFEYQLHIDEGIDTQELFVPAMLIQPYVENAIWHGLMNLENRKGILQLNISCKNHELQIEVEDNGVGRAFVKEENRTRSHKSMGMQLGEKRLMMINQLQDFENARVFVTDLYDENGHARGTRINIHIPIKP